MVILYYSFIYSGLLRWRSLCVDQTGFELSVFLPWPSQCWDHRWGPSSPDLLWRAPTVLSVPIHPWHFLYVSNFYHSQSQNISCLNTSWQRQPSPDMHVWLAVRVAVGTIEVVFVWFCFVLFLSLISYLHHLLLYPFVQGNRNGSIWFFYMLTSSRTSTICWKCRFFNVVVVVLVCLFICFSTGWF